MKRIKNSKIFYNFLFLLTFLFGCTEFILGSAARTLIDGMYRENDKFPIIKDMVIDYEFRAQDQKKSKTFKEEDIPWVGEGKIFYKFPYFLRIETIFTFHPSLQGDKLITIKDGKNTVIFKEDFIKPLSIEVDNRYPLLINFPFLYLLKYEEMDKILYPVVVGYENVGSGELKGMKVAVISVIDKTKMYERYRIYLDIKNYTPVKTFFYPFEKDSDGIEVIYKGFSYIADGRIWPRKILIYYFNQIKKTKFLYWVIYIKNVSINVGLIDDLFETKMQDIQSIPPITK